jgi:membrane-bound lytic murein transglycosylase D
MKKIAVFIFLFVSFSAFCQPIEIPETIFFAGMQLNLSKSVRDDLQKQVIELTRNKTYFQAKVNRTDTYFPIIERVFVEEGIPADFKYLIIQESSMQSDAISSSNAVGFWQFKKESAIEVGVKVNDEVDERKHIVESTRGAARYLKKNYLMLTNWIYALIAYNTGLGGVKQYVDTKYVGVSEMDINASTHWYAIKFLAHKLAYEDKVGYNKQPELSLLEYTKETKGKTISELASITQIAEEKLKEYNKWALKSRIPEDEDYTLMLPVTYLEKEQVATRLGIDLNKQPSLAAEAKEPEPIAKQTNKSDNYEGVPLLITYNNLDAIQARAGDSPAKLAFAGGISPEKFFRYNDMQTFDEVKPEKIYYLESKNNKGITLYHTVLAGESIWDISQKYGIKIKQLLKKNRMEEGEALQEGRLMYLKYKRPDDEPVVVTLKPVLTVVSAIVQPKPVSTVTSNNTTVSVTVASSPNIEQPVLTKTADTIQITKKPITTTKILSKKDTIKDSSLTYHVVAMQQTLFALARHYGTKVDSIKSWNGIGTEGVKFDQKIIVGRNSKSLTSKYKQIQVKNNQKISFIASEVGISLENILLWNNKRDTLVIEGELLKVKK